MSFPKSFYTTIDYSQLPAEFRKAHPEAPGGGIPTPPRIGAPAPPPGRESHRESHRENRVSSNRGFSASNQGFDKSCFTQIDYSQMPETFRRAHPEAPGGGIPASERIGAPPPPPRAYRESGNSSMTSHRRLPDSCFTKIDYSQMPEQFRRANPEAPGGGIPTPERIGAPTPSPDEYSNRRRAITPRMGVRGQNYRNL